MVDIGHDYFEDILNPKPIEERVPKQLALAIGVCPLKRGKRGVKAILILDFRYDYDSITPYRYILAYHNGLNDLYPEINLYEGPKTPTLEFNKVVKRHKLKVVYQAAEFREKSWR